MNNAVTMTHHDPGTTVNALREIALDGIHYACLSHMGLDWRLGALKPLWLEDIANVPKVDDTAQKALQARGIWLAPAIPAPPIAVMCCGLGSLWPGMGRELYDNFPAARIAMDKIASLADWDILGLMDEPDIEKISQTRWQIPYLFLLEYAQWSQFVSLGLQPAMLCGHSLGELVALCLAGVYSLESAWYLLDTRAEHITELEAKSSSQSGMLAISADYSIISEILQAYPGLAISNRNTSRQFILSGPRESLVLARKNLRHRHIPSMLLNISLAFHNPAMRILRDLSLRRLNALEMQAPQIPMLSCVTTGLYPQEQKNICRYITDLDENTVAWEGSVQAMREIWGIRCFLELGPRDTLCGLVEEIDKRNACIASSSKGRETQAMREACARLFSLGYLPYADIQRSKDRRSDISPPSHDAQPVFPGPAALHTASLAGVDTTALRTILQIIAQASGKNVSDIRLDMDLRHDLGLRSSSFPFLIHETEQQLGHEVELENLIQLVTVADIARFLAGGADSIPPADTNTPPSAPRHWRNRPLERFTFFLNTSGDIELRAAPLDFCGKGIGLAKGALVIILAYDAALFPRIWKSVAPLGPRLAVPANLMDKCASLLKAGAEIIEMDCELSPETPTTEIMECLSRLASTYGAPAGIFIAAGSTPKNPPEASLSLLNKIIPLCKHYALKCMPHPWICALETIPDTGSLAQAGKFISLMHTEIGGDIPYLAIAWLDDTSSNAGQMPDEAGDMFAQEILYGRKGGIIWKQGDFSGKYCRASTFFNLVHPEANVPYPPQAGLFQGECQFSRFADPALSAHGSGIYTPVNPADCAGQGASIPWLPLGQMLAAILAGAETLAPWLSVIGFSDMRLFDFPGLPEGITREFRLQARARPWIPQDGVITRMCHVSLSARELTPNGRHTLNYHPACDGVCWLAGNTPPVPALWNPRERQSASGQQTFALDPFYSALGFRHPWKMLAQALQPQPPFYEYYLDAREIAKDINWNYKDFLYMVEGIYEGALHILACGGSPDTGLSPQELAANLNQWRCGAIGFIRFAGLPKGNLNHYRIQLRRSWQDEQIARFDAQVYGSAWSPLLTLNHLEFEKIATE